MELHINKTKSIKITEAIWVLPARFEFDIVMLILSAKLFVLPANIHINGSLL